MWTFVVSSVAFMLILYFVYRRNSIRLLNDDAAVKHPALLLLLNFSGIVLFGIFPAMFLPFPAFEISGWNLTQWLTLVALMCATAAVAWNVADRDLRKSRFTVNPALLSFGFLGAYFVLRILFIICYELWFRGFLLDFSVEKYGTVTAVVINVVLYVLLHAFNGKREMISCVPFGILLCAMALWFDSPLPAIGIHLALTVPYDVQFVRIKSEKNSS